MTKILIGKALCERLDLKEALKKGGHTVYVCEDEPFSVLSRFTECRPGIIIIDADLACRKGLLRHINKVFGHTYTVTVARADMISDIDIPDECIDRILTERKATRLSCRSFPARTYATARGMCWTLASIRRRTSTYSSRRVSGLGGRLHSGPITWQWGSTHGTRMSSSRPTSMPPTGR